MLVFESLHLEVASRRDCLTRPHQKATQLHPSDDYSIDVGSTQAGRDLSQSIATISELLLFMNNLVSAAETSALLQHFPHQ
jgi:hypothetical protein